MKQENLLIQMTPLLSFNVHKCDCKTNYIPDFNFLPQNWFCPVNPFNFYRVLKLLQSLEELYAHA